MPAWSKMPGSIRSDGFRRFLRQQSAVYGSGAARKKGNGLALPAAPEQESDSRLLLPASKAEGPSQSCRDRGRWRILRGNNAKLFLDRPESGRSWPPPKRHVGLWVRLPRPVPHSLPALGCGPRPDKHLLNLANIVLRTDSNALRSDSWQSPHPDSRPTAPNSGRTSRDIQRSMVPAGLLFGDSRSLELPPGGKLGTRVESTAGTAPQKPSKPMLRKTSGAGSAIKSPSDLGTLGRVLSRRLGCVLITLSHARKLCWQHQLWS